MKNFSHQFLLVSLGLFTGLLLAIGHGVMAEKPAKNGGLPLEDIRSLSEVFGKIKDNYVEDVKDKTLLENAIRGMLSGLDPHSTYLDKDSYKELRVGTTGEFGGLGIVVGMEDGYVKVVSPIDDTPADRAGIKAADLIIKLDKKTVKGMTLDEAVKLMRGKPGTGIDLTVVREGENKPLVINVVRDKIRVKSVKQRTLAPGFGYVRISQFQERTGRDLREAIRKIKEENKNELNGLILDLRNNPGGLLDAAVAVSDTFLEKGIIVSVRGRNPEAEMKHQANPNDWIKGAPLVVLINAGSASASEIVAGALQDHKRGVIMGEPSFGKGSVQTVVPLGNDSAIKLTTARYYTPNDRSIQAEGIQPDIVVDNLKVSASKEKKMDRLKEADLNKHLENGDAKPTDKDKQEKQAKKRINLASDDYALYEALNLLKGLHLLSRR